MCCLSLLTTVAIVDNTSGSLKKNFYQTLGTPKTNKHREHFHFYGRNIRQLEQFLRATDLDFTRDKKNQHKMKNDRKFGKKCFRAIGRYLPVGIHTNLRGR
jgi:hypothetical protein